VKNIKKMKKKKYMNSTVMYCSLTNKPIILLRVRDL